MTTKTEIKLPSLPQPRIMPQDAKTKIAYGYGIDDMDAYARAAVEADRQDHLRDATKMMPSDEELIAFCGEEQFFLFCNEGEFLDIAKSVLSRFGRGETRMDAGSSARNDGDFDQPAASAEPVQLAWRVVDRETGAPRTDWIDGDGGDQSAEPVFSGGLIQRAYADPAPAQPAALDVLAERQRQIQAEGWTPEHDDQYTAYQLGLAAGCYITHDDPDCIPPLWPWDARWWKPKTPRRNLIKAGALILAEIERLDRAAARAAKEADNA